MKTMNWMAALAVLVAAATSGVQAGTLRVGEQDSCKITGVTTIADGSVSFDLTGVKAAGEVTKAMLRLWVTVGGNDTYGHNFTMANWNKPGFDGFKISDESGKVLDTVYPFYLTVACHEWNVTEAVKGKPGAGKVTLKTNFPLPPSDFGHAWKRVYLEITTSGEDADRPRQPTELKAKYRSGQVFLTWKQIPFDGAFFDSTYRVYKHNAPITAASLGSATLVGEVNKNSQVNYRRTAYSYGGLMSYGSYSHLWGFIPIEGTKDKGKNLELLQAKLPKRFNFVIDEDWPKSIQDGKWLEDSKLLGDGASMPQGPGLPDDTGLFVYTVAKDEDVFFAVTSVIRGNENRSDFTSANALAAATSIKKDTPKPILQVVFNSGDRKNRFQIREYVLWGGPEQGLHSEPSTPFMFHLNVSDNKLTSVSVASIYTNGRGGYNAGHDRSYLPPTRLAPFPVLHCSLTYGGGWMGRSYWVYGNDVYRPAAKALESGDYGFAFPVAFGVGGLGTHDNVYGYHDRANTGRDPRQGLVIPYLQNRALAALTIAGTEFPQVDRNRTVYGGEGDVFLMGVHHPELFGTISVAQFAPWSAKAADRLWEMVGKREWGLKNEQGFPVWDWNDPIWQSKKYPRKTWSYFSVCQSPNYAKADDLTHWQNMGYPKFYLDLQEEKRGGSWWWCDIGDAPDGKGSLVPLNEPYPAFTRVNFCETPQPQWRKEPRGTLNGYLAFGPNHGYVREIRKDQALAARLTEGMQTVDAPDRFEMAFRIGDHGHRLNGQSVPPTVAEFGQTDITLWRLQQFKVEAGKQYRWSNRKIATGEVLQTGTIAPDERGLLTVPGFFVDRDPGMNKLILTPDAGASPAVDETAVIKLRLKGQERELPFADYVAACRNPVLAVPVELPATTLKISAFTQAGACNPDGSRTLKDQGGWGMGAVETMLTIPQGGDYVLTLRAKGGKAEAGNWPAVIASIGGTWGKSFPPRIVSSREYAGYRWYAKLDAGKLNLKLGTLSDYYNAGVLPGCQKGRTLEFKDVTIARVAEADLEKPSEIVIDPQGIAAPAGLPTRMIAQVLNNSGQPIASPIAWKCDGAAISADGILQAAAPGTCTVTASAAGLEARAEVEIAPTFNEHFNEGCGTLRGGWTAVDLGQVKGVWGTPASGHHMLNSLLQSSRQPVQSLLLWAPAAPWVNYEFQADIVICPALGHASDGTRGLVVAARDGDNQVRLEIRHSGEATTVAVVKRKAGADSVLAESRTAPGYQPFDWKTNPLCPAWHAQETAPNLRDWHLDRMRVRVKPGELQAWLADKELFPGGVKDPDIGAGAIGLYAEHAAAFDNVVVKGLQ